MNKRKMKEAYFEKMKQINKAYSQCADEIIEVYNKWIKMYFDSEDDFKRNINNYDLEIIYSESNLYGAICALCGGERNCILGEFRTQDNDKKSMERFKIDLALILFHIKSICENECNKKNIEMKIKEIVGEMI